MVNEQISYINMSKKNTIIHNVNNERKSKSTDDPLEVIRKFCSFCDMEFTNKNTEYRLQSHIKYTHDKLTKPPNKPREELCKICSKIIKGGKMKQHVDTMHGKENLHCEYCNKVYKSFHTLKRHKVQCKVETCSECGIIVARDRMKKHVIISHSPYESRPFKCQYCPKGYAANGDLKKHVQRVHLKTTFHKCLLCFKAFTYKSELVIHKRTHSTNKEYKCETCNHYFKHIYMLNDHRKKVHQLSSKFAVDKANKLYRQLLLNNIKEEM